MTHLGTTSHWQCDACDKKETTSGSSSPYGWGEVTMDLGVGWGNHIRTFLVCDTCKGKKGGQLLPYKEWSVAVKETFKKLFSKVGLVS